MRTIALGLVLGTLLVVAANTLVRADEGKEGDEKAALAKIQGRLDAAEAELGYLRSREKALSTYVLDNEQRARDLRQLAGRMRSLGFEARQIPADSRIALLRGLESLADSLGQHLPKVTRSEQQLLREAEKARKGAGSGR
jgi:hypothetical protein